MGVQMDPVSILLLDCWVFLCVSMREGERESLPSCARVCVCTGILSWYGSLKSTTSFLLPEVKTTVKGGQGERKTKVTGIVGRKESVSLRQISQWRCQLAKVSRKLS